MNEARIDGLEARLARIEAELADKRRQHYDWRVRAAMAAAYTAAVAAGAVSAVLLTYLPHPVGKFVSSGADRAQSRGVGMKEQADTWYEITLSGSNPGRSLSQQSSPPRRSVGLAGYKLGSMPPEQIIIQQPAAK